MPRKCSMTTRTSYHVAARYTAGSPAQVDYETAIRVAKQEAEAYKDALESMDTEFAKAVARGVEGIVYATTEVRSTIMVEDLITNTWFAVPVAEWRQQHWYERTDRS